MCLIISLLDNINWEVFGHLPYFPDLAQNYLHLFPKLKYKLVGMKFNTHEEFIQEVEKIFADLDTDFYRTGIKKLVTRHNKCLDRNGDYIEK